MRGSGRRPVAFYYCISSLHSPTCPISTSLALLSVSVKIGRMPTEFEERYTSQAALHYRVSVCYVWKYIYIYIYKYVYIHIIIILISIITASGMSGPDWLESREMCWT